MISKDLVASKGLNAGQLVREAGKLIKGGGGGAPHFATAGGKDCAGIDAAVDKVIELCNLLLYRQVKRLKGLRVIRK